MTTDLGAVELACYLDHTLLSPDATAEQVRDLALEARELGVWSVCVSPSMLPIRIAGPLPRVTTVCGFPSGKHHPEVKAAEAALAVSQGAQEVDLMIDLGLVHSGDAEGLVAEIARVRSVLPAPLLLKVIIESAALSDQEIVLACRAAEQGGADYVKTSTGFHPAGGASTHAVSLMARTVAGRLGVKASGGIRDRSTALAMIEAGATRLGCSASRAVLAETER